jgi:hypothetical protein
MSNEIIYIFKEDYLRMTGKMQEEINALRGQLEREKEAPGKVEFIWGNPLTPQIFYIEQDLVDIIYELFKQVTDAHKLSLSCECETCQKIREVTWTPIFG